MVAPLIAAEACVTFSNGAVHRGKKAIEAAYSHNFEMIKSERYVMSEVHWVFQSDETAIYTFRFEWTGIINGESMSGAGHGTTVLIKENESWVLMAEQLGRG